jgi:hypothetical protein
VFFLESDKTGWLSSLKSSWESSPSIAGPEDKVKTNQKTGK